MRRMKRGATWAATGVVVAGAVIFVTVRPTAADAPAGRFTVSQTDGTVTDNQTKLVWQQAVPFYTYTQAQAADYCTSNTALLSGYGWRLPSVTELQTIVDRSRSSPAIDPTAFPSTPADYFWTSSLYLPSAGYTWAIFFDDGRAGSGLASDALRVRCVR